MGGLVLWLLTASISERGRLAHIDSKLVSSRRGVRAVDVAGGSQLGETGEQQCLFCVVLCLLVPSPLVPEDAFRCSVGNRSFLNTADYCCCAPYRETKVPRFMRDCIDLSARLRGLVSRSARHGYLV